MLKKSAALITCVMLVLTLLAGCSGDTNSASGTAAGSENIEINIVSSTMRLESMVDGWEQMIANFEAENPGVTVNLDMQDWEELPQYIAQARMAGEQIDIIRTTGGQIRSTLAPAGALMDITDVVEPIADRFTEGTLDAYNIGGRQWGIPYSATEVSCVYYNKTMFDELGLEEPQTLEELQHCADVIREEKGIENPWIHQGAIVSYWPMFFEETYAQTSGNDSIAKTEDWLSGNSSFVNDETIEAFAMIGDLFERNILTTDSLNTDETGMKALFAQQEAAMFYGGSWEYAPTMEIVNDAFEVGVFMFPSMADGLVPEGCGAADSGIAVTSTCNKEHADVIAKFLEFMTRPESAQLTVGAEEPLVPPLEGVEATDMPCAEELLSFVPKTIMYLDWMMPAELVESLGNQIAGVAAGQITPEAAAQAVQDTYETIVQEDGYSYDWYNDWTDEQWAAVALDVNADA